MHGVQGCDNRQDSKKLPKMLEVKSCGSADLNNKNLSEFISFAVLSNQYERTQAKYLIFAFWSSVFHEFMVSVKGIHCFEVMCSSLKATFLSIM